MRLIVNPGAGVCVYLLSPGRYQSCWFEGTEGRTEPVLVSVAADHYFRFIILEECRIYGPVQTGCVTPDSVIRANVTGVVSVPLAENGPIAVLNLVPSDKPRDIIMLHPLLTFYTLSRALEGSFLTLFGQFILRENDPGN
jgi:hypothetical protein